MLYYIMTSPPCYTCIYIILYDVMLYMLYIILYYARGHQGDRRAHTPRGHLAPGRPGARVVPGLCMYVYIYIYI